MEGLGALGINWKILLGQIVNFLILLLILRKFLYRPIVKILSERKEKIAKSLEDIEAARKNLEHSEIESKKKISGGVAEAQKIIDAAKKDAEKSSRETLEKAAGHAQKIVSDAKSTAAAEKEKVLSNARRDLAELVTLATEKIIKEKENQKDVERAIQKI